MTRANLHVAGMADAPRPASDRIADALDGSARDVLASMRLTLARKIDAGEVSSNSLASSLRELDELDGKIRALDAADEAEEARRAGRSSARRPFDAAAL